MIKNTPKIIVFFLTYRCNAKCIMCSIWKKQKDFMELGKEEIADIFKDPALTRDVEIINITGGESTLRDDFGEIINTFLSSCPKLKRIDIPTNGIDTNLVLDKIETALANIFPYPDVRITVTVSVDAVNEDYEKIRGVERSFNKVKKTIKGLKELETLYRNLSISLNAVITKLNFNKLNSIREFAHKNKIGLNYTLGAISEIGVESDVVRDNFYINLNKERDCVVSFLKAILKNNEIAYPYAKFLINCLENKKRKAGCSFREGKTVLIDADAKVYACGNYRRFLLGDLRVNKFSDLWIKRKYSKHNYKICESCESNCYWDE